ncbi:hypothetical protein KBD45_08530 [Candidatus Dojkabacteria bacterium]|nr:hypothetical protein [Candidatus Dojkabacteria bacterium]
MRHIQDVLRVKEYLINDLILALETIIEFEDVKEKDNYRDEHLEQLLSASNIAIIELKDYLENAIYADKPREIL